MGRYERPLDLQSAAALLRANGLQVIAGGTDFYPARVGQAIAGDILDLTAIVELRGIADLADCWRIGATTTWSDIIAAPLPPLFDGLKRAAREVGGVQIQNRGTIGGNLCNASPAADGTPNLIALNAAVECLSARGARQIPVEQFVAGNRRTLLRPQEIVSALMIPKPLGPARSTFLKLGARKYLVISIAMAAVTIEHDAGNLVTAARVCVGSCSAVAQRLFALEDALTGAALHQLSGRLAPSHFSALAPIGDVRGTADYRRDAAFELVRRALQEFA